MASSVQDPLIPNAERLPFELGVEIVYSHVDLTDSQISSNARKTLLDSKFQGDTVKHEQILNAADEVSQVVRVSRNNDQGESEDLLDIFTANQIIDMQDRIHDYLGGDISQHLEGLKQPKGYPAYIGKLATYFWTTDSDVTSSFGDFERRHIDPNDSSRGPLEKNSRELAVLANDKILRQLESFYQADFKIELTGPKKQVEGSRVTWERGIAECQFMVLDYVRDLLATSVRRNVANQTPTMTVEDIGVNITNIVNNRKQLVRTAEVINPLLSERLTFAIQSVSEYGVEVMHRGRMGAKRFEREPDGARRAIHRVETLLMHVAAMNESQDDQAEIPILDI